MPKPAAKIQRTESAADQIVDAEDHHIGGGFQNEQEIFDALPDFLQNIRDANNVKPGEPNYDPTTLKIPQS